MNKGDVLAFNSYETHSSTLNETPNPRLAFKIVIGEKENFLDDVDRLDISSFTENSFINHYLKK